MGFTSSLPSERFYLFTAIINNHNLVEVVPSRHVRASELFLLAQIMFCNFEIVEYHVARECLLVPQLHDIKWDSNCTTSVDIILSQTGYN